MKINHQECLELWRQGSSVADLAKRYDVVRSSIYLVLRGQVRSLACRSCGAAFRSMGNRRYCSKVCSATGRGETRIRWRNLKKSVCECGQLKLKASRLCWDCSLARRTVHNVGNIVAAYNSGYTSNQISEVLGVWAPTICQIIRDAGVTMRRKGRVVAAERNRDMNELRKILGVQ